MHMAYKYIRFTEIALHDQSICYMFCYQICVYVHYLFLCWISSLSFKLTPPQFCASLIYRSDGSADVKVPSTSSTCIVKERRIGPKLLVRNLCIILQCFKVIGMTVLCIIVLKVVTI